MEVIIDFLGDIFDSIKGIFNIWKWIFLTNIEKIAFSFYTIILGVLKIVGSFLILLNGFIIIFVLVRTIQYLENKNIIAKILSDVIESTIGGYLVLLSIFPTNYYVYIYIIYNYYWFRHF